MANRFHVDTHPPGNEQRAAWHVRCGCRWRQEVAGADDRAQEVAEGSGRRHLRERHGSTDPRERRHGKVLILDGIDERLLTKVELARYRELVREEQTMGLLNLSTRETVRMRSYWLGMPIWIAVFAATIGWVFASDGSIAGVNVTGGTEALALIALAVILLLGLPLLIAVARHEARAVLARRVEDYLSSIGFDSREPSIAGGWSGGEGNKSTRQMQHEWYGSHSELTWRDRVMGEALGLDADTYVSNFLEHDKG